MPQRRVTIESIFEGWEMYLFRDIQQLEHKINACIRDMSSAQHPKRVATPWVWDEVKTMFEQAREIREREEVLNRAGGGYA